MFNNILVVCIGNICRSPTAEAILKERVRQAGLSANVSSAGIAALVGHSIESNAKEILMNQGIDASAHQARQLNAEMLVQAELVLVMEEFQRKKIECMFPNVCGKVHLLGKWGKFEVPDPYKQSRVVFEDTFQLIVEGIDQWQAKLWG